MAARSPSKRREAKERNKLFKDLYFLIKWLEDDEEDLYDVLPAGRINTPESTDILDLVPGQQCQTYFNNILYPVEVVANGTRVQMKDKHKVMERDVEELDMEESNSEELMLAEGTQRDHDTGRDGSEVEINITADKEKRSGQGGKEIQEKSDSAKKSQSALGGKDIKEKSDSVKKSQSGQRGKGVQEKSNSAKKSQSGYGIQGNRNNWNEDKGKESRSKACHSGEKGRERTNTVSTQLKKSGEDGEHRECKGKTKSLQRKCAGTESMVLDSDVSGTDEDEMPCYPFQAVSTPTMFSKKKRKISPQKRCLSNVYIEPYEEYSPVTKRPRLNLSPQPTIDASSELPSEPEEESSFEVRRRHNLAKNEHLKSMIGLTKGIPPTTVIGEVTKMKEKLRVLEKSHVNLKRRVSQQAEEIQRLKSSSADISSASDIPPDRFSPPLRKSTTPSLKPSTDDTPDFLKGIDDVKLANAKLQSEPGTAALKLMDCVFTTEELVNSNPSGTTKSKDPARQRTIRPLDPFKMKYIDDFLQKKWGVSTQDKGIKKRMTQKCTDYFTDHHYKHLRAE